MSGKALIMSLMGLGAFFWGVNHLLTQSIPPLGVQQSESNSTHVPVIRAPASVKEGEMAAALDAVIQSHPEMVGAPQSGRGLLGVNLDSPDEVAFFKTEEGRARFFSQFQNVENFDSAIQDLEQSWVSAAEGDLARREALLEMTVGLMNFSKSDRLKSQVLGEYDRFHKSGSSFEARDYAARALQEYLDHEPDLEKRNEELKKRGIPVIEAGINRTSN